MILILVDGCQDLPSIVAGVVPLMENDRNFSTKFRKNIMGSSDIILYSCTFNFHGECNTHVEQNDIQGGPRYHRYTEPPSGNQMNAYQNFQFCIIFSIIR